MDRKLLIILIFLNLAALSLGAFSVWMSYQSQQQLLDHAAFKKEITAGDTIGSQLGTSARGFYDSADKTRKTLDAQAAKTAQEVDTVVQETMEVLKPQLQKAANDLSKIVDESSQSLNEGASEMAQNLQIAAQKLQVAWERELEAFQKNSQAST